MTNSKSTKNALISSILVLALCFSMLLGTTFAWFTDTAASTDNKIVAGTLDVELWQHTAADAKKNISDSHDALFTDDILWEPNRTEVVYLSIKNNGSLALKYKVAIDVTSVSEVDLTEVMEYDIIENAKYGEVTAWANEGTSVEPGTNSTQAVDVKLLPGAEHFFALAVHMDKDAGNQYQGGSASFDITVLATQVGEEKDSFGDSYDNTAVYDEEVQVEAQPWHQLDAVHSDTVVDGGGYTYAADYQEVCLAGNADITIKGVTFQNGLTLYTNNTESTGTITLEECVIYLNNGSGNPYNDSMNMHYADYGLYIGAVSSGVNYVFKNCTFTAYDNHTYTNNDKGYNVYIGGNYSADSITFDGCTFEKSSKHGIGCSFGYIPDQANNTATYYDLTVTNCNFVDWNKGDYNGAAIRGNIADDVMTTYQRTITITKNTFGNSNGSSKNDVAIDGWQGTWN